MPTFLGFWLSWLPFSVPLGWPFCWHVFGVLDFYSRRSVHLAVFSGNPSAAEVALALDRAVTKEGKAPKYLVCDKGTQFWSSADGGPTAALATWKERHGVKVRFGALGKHGSIARTERFLGSLKREFLRRVLVPFGIDALVVDLESYARWYNTARPHQGLAGATPEERHRQVTPTRELLRLEVRERYPPHDARGSPGEAKRATLRGLRLAQLDGHERLPLVLLDYELRDAA